MDTASVANLPVPGLTAITLWHETWLSLAWRVTGFAVETFLPTGRGSQAQERRTRPLHHTQRQKQSGLGSQLLTHSFPIEARATPRLSE